MKDLIISKELLGSVMEFKKQNVYSKDLDFIRLNENNIQFAFKTEHNIQSVFNINIYEFAFKCKEWIVTQGYGIKTETYDYMEDDSFSGTYWYIIKLRAKNWKYGGCPNCGANATEIEATIKACEWIIKNEQLCNN